MINPVMSHNFKVTEEFSCSVKIFAVEERSKVNIMEMNLDNLLDELRSSLPEGNEGEGETGSKNNTTGSEVKQSRNRNQSSNNSKSSSDDVSGQGLGL